jgi:hypothetical protein
MTDGYIELIEKQMEYLNEMDDIYQKQLKLNAEVANTAKEINEMPKMPKDLDRWMESVPELNNNKKRFKISDYANIFKISRKYESLLEDRDINQSKLKVVVIDNLLNKIKKALNEE